MADNQRGIRFFNRENDVDRNSGLELQQEKEKRKAIKAGAEELTEQDRNKTLNMAGKAAVGWLFRHTGEAIDDTSSSTAESEVAATQADKEAAGAMLNNQMEQQAIDAANSRVIPVTNALTGLTGASQEVTKATSGVLAGFAGGKKSIEAAATTIKPATPTKEQAEYSEQLYQSVKTGGQWKFRGTGDNTGGKSSIAGTVPAGKAPDNSYVVEAREKLKLAVDFAKDNRMKWTSNGNPWLTYYYNQWHGTADPDVANATAYYQQCNTQFKNESDLYEKVLANNQKAIEQYIKGKENYFKNASIMLSAASKFGSSSRNVRYIDVFQQQEEVYKATREWQKEQAKVMEERFAKGEALDPNAVPALITGINQDIVAGNLAAVDGYKFLLRLAANEKSFNYATQKMMAELRDSNGGHLGNCMSDEAIKTAAIIANNKRLREMFIQRAEMNRVGAEIGEKETGINYMFTQFGDKDLAVLGKLFQQWEADEATERGMKNNATKSMGAQYAQMTPFMRNAYISAVDPFLAEEVNRALNQTDLPTPAQFDAISKADKSILENDKAPLSATTAVLRKNGVDWPYMPGNVRDKAAASLADSNLIPWNSSTFAGALDRARAAVTSFDAFITLRDENIDSKALRERLQTLVNSVRGNMPVQVQRVIKESIPLDQINQLLKGTNDITMDKVKAILAMNSEALKQNRTRIFIAALNNEPIIYGNNKKDTSPNKIHNLVFNETGQRLYTLLGKQPFANNLDALQLFKTDPVARAQLTQQWVNELDSDEGAVAMRVISGDSTQSYYDSAAPRIDKWIATQEALLMQQLAKQENIANTIRKGK